MLPAELEFAVRSEDVFNQHQSQIPGYKQLVRDDNNELVLSIKIHTELLLIWKPMSWHTIFFKNTLIQMVWKNNIDILTMVL